MSEIRNGINYNAYAFGGNIAAQADLTAEYATRFNFPFGTVAAEGLAWAVAQTDLWAGALDAYMGKGMNPYLLPMSVRLGLLKEALPLKDSYNEGVDAANPPPLFYEWKGDKDWVGWLRRPPHRGGPTPKQLQNVLQWNAHHMAEENENRRGELITAGQEYLDGADAAVTAGKLSPSFAARAQAIVPGVRFLIADPLNPRNIASSSAYKKRGLVMLDSVHGPGQLPHELTHHVGGFEGRFLDEVGTEMVSEVVERRDEAPENTKSSLYMHMQRAVAKVLELAGVTAYEVSDIYVGDDSSRNTKALKQLVESRTGEDTLGALERRFNERQKYWKRRLLMNSYFGMTLAGLEVLKDYEPTISYADILRSDKPELSEDELSAYEEIMTTMTDKNIVSFYLDLIRMRLNKSDETQNSIT